MCSVCIICMDKSEEPRLRRKIANASAYEVIPVSSTAPPDQNGATAECMFLKLPGLHQKDEYSLAFEAPIRIVFVIDVFHRNQYRSQAFCPPAHANMYMVEALRQSGAGLRIHLK